MYVLVFCLTWSCAAVKEFAFVKDRIEVIDHENHIFKYSVIEGGLVGLKLSSFTAEITFSSTREGGCLAKVKIEYESLEDGSLLSEGDVISIKEGNLAMIEAVEEYLLADPNAYVWNLSMNQMASAERLWRLRNSYSSILYFCSTGETYYCLVSKRFPRSARSFEAVLQMFHCKWGV